MRLLELLGKVFALLRDVDAVFIRGQVLGTRPKELLTLKYCGG